MGSSFGLTFTSFHPFEWIFDAGEIRSSSFFAVWISSFPWLRYKRNCILGDFSADLLTADVWVSLSALCFAPVAEVRIHPRVPMTVYVPGCCGFISSVVCFDSQLPWHPVSCSFSCLGSFVRLFFMLL